ncbi:MAG: diaminopropionate ammonia-lyase [Betaproteobacteria bacterium]
MTVHHPAGIRAFRNPRAAAPAAAYAEAHQRILNDAGFTSAFQEIRRWPGYAPTPLQGLPALAGRLGVAAVTCKDESGRFGLKSFKALGGAYAVLRLLQATIAAKNDGRPVASRELVAGAYKALAAAVTVTCATDGNHGRSVAWGAQLFGCRCVIFVHEKVSEGRCEAIARYGAEVIRVQGNYDDSVRHAAAVALQNGWTVISDTSYDGYRDIPIDVMHGYGVMAREVIAQMTEGPPTHVFVQAGVGGLAAALCAAFWIAWGKARPQLLLVEPLQADCYFQSGAAGHPVTVTGALDTVMAGLACGEVSPLAWAILDAGASAYVAIDDAFALDAVRVLARPDGDDPAIVAGETGAAGLAALLAAHADNEVLRTLGLDTASRVLLIGSEGDTDPEIYRQILADAAVAPT